MPSDLKTMSAAEIRAADLLIENCPLDGKINCAEITVADLKNAHIAFSMDDLLKAAGVLKEHGFIEFIETERLPEFRLLGKAIRLRNENKKFSHYLELDLAKEEREEVFKDLQVQDLKTKLELMNVEQSAFWKAQTEKNKQTTLIAIISALFALFSMLKVMGCLD